MSAMAAVGHIATRFDPERLPVGDPRWGLKGRKLDTLEKGLPNPDLELERGKKYAM